MIVILILGGVCLFISFTCMNCLDKYQKMDRHSNGYNYDYRICVHRNCFMHTNWRRRNQNETLKHLIPVLDARALRVGISYFPPSELLYHYNQKLYVHNQMLYLGGKRL